MAWTRVNSNGSRATTGGSSANVTLASVTGGNRVVVWIAGYSSTSTQGNGVTFNVTVSDTVNTYSLVKAIGWNSTWGLFEELYVAKNVTGGNLTITVTPTSASTAQFTLIAAEYSGDDNTSVSDNSNSGTGNSTSASSGAVTQASGSDLFVGLGTCAKLGGGTSESMSVTGTGWTMFRNFDMGTGTALGVPLGATDLFSSDSVSHTATWTLSSADAWWAIGASFKPAAAAAAAFPPKGLLVHPAYGLQHPFLN